MRVLRPLLLPTVTALTLAAWPELAVAQQTVTLRDAGLPRKFTVEAIKARTATAPAELVLLEDGRASTPWARRVLRDRLAVQLVAGTDPVAFAAAHGLTWQGEAAGAAGWHVFTAAGPEAVLALAEALPGTEGVTAVQPLLRRLHRKRLVPNDPLFASQWHLNASRAAGTHVNVQSVWDTWRGAGVRIGIVDDGLQVTHEDLAANVDLVNDHDWNDATPDDPSPDVSIDFHGTSCAGVAAARGNNAKGVSGAAPEATLVGLRLISDFVDDADEAAALAWRSDIIAVKSNSWGPDDAGNIIEGPGPLTAAALKTAAETGRGGRGTIFTWAAGNGGNGASAADNSNNDGYANSIYTIAVGAVTSSGARASYSEPGANVVVCAPSDGALGITTVDLTGAAGYNDGATGGEPADAGYTSSFGGTSSACPLAAGCVALLLQARPELGWRDVQEILMRTATKVAPTNADWITNGGGLHFNHNFGAGVIDVQAAVNAAATWTPLGPQQSQTAALTGLPASIPDNSAAGLVRTFTLDAANALRVEHVTLTVTLNHTNRGQLAVSLTSPQGTVSRLAEKHSDSGDNYTQWTFSSVRHWAENSAGTWTLTVADLTSGTTGTLGAATLRVYGTPLGPVNVPPSVTSAVMAPTGTAWTDETASITDVQAADPEGEPVTLRWQWETSADGTLFTPVAVGTGSMLALSGVTPGVLLRCRVTPNDGVQDGTPLVTDPVPVNRRPLQFARRGQPYAYDSELFVHPPLPAFTRSVIVNEFSQGPGQSKEWMEFLTLQATDMRGWKVGDRSGTFTTFQNTVFWQNVPAGTLIVVWNNADRDPLIPAAADLDASDRTLVFSHTNATACSPGTWGGLSNNNTERVVLTDADGVIVDAVSFNADNVHDPKLGSVGSTRSAAFVGGAEAEVENAALWSIGAATAATPGAANGAANLALVQDARSGLSAAQPQFRFGAGSASVAGLTLDPLTGVLAGTVTAPAGVYQISLERYTGSEVAAQSFALFVSDPATDATDADGDGLPQLLELALGLDPAVADAPALPVSFEWENAAPVLVFSRPAGLTGPVYTVQESADLLSWQPSGPVLSDTLENGVRTVRVRAAGGGPRRFLRLRVTAP